jgi:hypothetical protein
METITTTVYTFDELSDEAKDKARTWMREASDFEFYQESVIDDAKEVGKLIGINIDKIYYSGFSSQGDGACFEGNYSYKAGSVKAIKEYAPQDMELHRIATELYKLQKPSFYSLTAGVKHQGHYYHELCTNIDVYVQNPALSGDDHASDEITESLKELLRDFMRWIYKQLDINYDYMMSDESIDETIKINEYTFNENGKRED